MSRATLLAFLQPWREVDEPIHRRLAQLADAKGDPREVVWIGCGAGRSPLWWAERFGAHTHGVDPDPDAIEQAERAARDAGLSSRVVFQVGDPTDLPHESQTFDLTVLHGLYLPPRDPARVVSEAARVTRPMGMILALVPSWLGEPQPQDTALLGALGLDPHQIVEWKQFFREVGIVELVVEDAALDGGWLDAGTIAPLARAWRLAGWTGVRALLAPPVSALRRLAGRRIIGLSILKGTRWPHS